MMENQLLGADRADRNQGRRRRRGAIDERFLPQPKLVFMRERQSFKRLASYEAWAWFQAMTYWIPGRIGWIVRRALYGPFFQRADRAWHIAEFCSIQPPNRFQIGYRSVLSRFVVINAQGGVILGDYSGIGPFSQVITVTHQIKNLKDVPWGEQPRILETAPVIIEPHVWVGAGCIILPGVRIGPNAVVAAGSTVTRDVPPFTLVGGVPAKVIRKLDAIPEGEYLFGSTATQESDTRHSNVQPGV